MFKDNTLFSRFDILFRKELASGFFTQQELERIEDSLQGNREGYENYFNHLKNLVIYMQINEPQIFIDEVKLPSKSSQKEQF